MKSIILAYLVFPQYFLLIKNIIFAYPSFFSKVMEQIFFHDYTHREFSLMRQPGLKSTYSVKNAVCLTIK